MQPTAILLKGDSVALLTAGLKVPENEDQGVVLGTDITKLKRLGQLTADACVTDPPYGFSFSGDNADWDSFDDNRKFANAMDDSKKFMEFCKDWSRPMMLNVLKKGSHLMAFTALRTIGPLHYGLMAAGYDIPRVMMWLYASGQVKQKHDLRPGGEPIFIARVPADDLLKLHAKEGRGQLHAQQLKVEDGKHPCDVVLDESLVENYAEVNEFVTNYHGTFFVSKPSAKDRDAFCADLPLQKKDNRLSHMTDNANGKVVKDVMAQNIHPTVKPIELMRRMIRTVSLPGHVIIDPFMGSGTTGVAAMLEGRHFIGIEREVGLNGGPDHFTLARTRIATAREEMAGK